jgi:hypothetical protein
MHSVHDPLTDWSDNERAFDAAVTQLRGPAAAMGLVLRQPHHPIEGWPHVLRAEVLPAGSGRVLSCIDVGLNRRGEMLWQTIPGEVRRFASFRPHDKDYYVRRLQRLVDAALAGDN